MTTQSDTTWTDGWTAKAPAEIDFAWAPNAGEDYAPREVDGLLSRDLGLVTASNGALAVARLRRNPNGSDPVWRSLDADFDMIYVLGGSVLVENAAGDRVHLKAGGCALHPRRHAYRLSEISDDFEAVQVLAPAHVVADTSTEPPVPEASTAHPVYSHDTDDQYVAGAGPRKFFLYRDLGTAAPSGGRIYFHVVRATAPGDGTGWHYHTMAQWFMVIGGNAVIRVEDRPRQPLTWGDAMCVGRGPSMRHNVTDFSADYLVLEMCIPAEYDTIAVDEPEGADAR